MTTTVTSRDGTRIAFDKLGEGPPVILVAGAFQFRAFDQTTVELAHRLADDGFTVVNYDRRGRGESGPTGPGSVEREVEDVAVLVEHVGGSAALYGSSSGAAIALWAAQERVGVTALALWEPPLSTDTASDAVAFAVELQALIEGGPHDRVVEFFMKDMPPEWLEGSKASPAWPVMVGIAPSLAGDAEALARGQGQPWSERWSSVDVPTVVLTGTETLPIFTAAADGLVAALPQARHVTIEAAGHGWSPEVMAGALSSFLRSVR